MPTTSSSHISITVYKGRWPNAIPPVGFRYLPGGKPMSPKNKNIVSPEAWHFWTFSFPLLGLLRRTLNPVTTHCAVFQEPRSARSKYKNKKRVQFKFWRGGGH